MDKRLKVLLLVVALVAVSAWAYFRLSVRYYAKQFVGLAEQGGSNMGFSSSLFQEMMKEVDWKEGQAWCSFFVKVIWLNVYPRDKVFLDKIITGSTQQTFENALSDNTGTVSVHFKRPRIGDIVIWRSRRNPSLGHAGIVTKVRPSYFMTVEGNTSDSAGGNQRIGGTVSQKKRFYDSAGMGDLELRGFIRKRII